MTEPKAEQHFKVNDHDVYIEVFEDGHVQVENPCDIYECDDIDTAIGLFQKSPEVVEWLESHRT